MPKAPSDHIVSAHSAGVPDYLLTIRSQEALLAVGALQTAIFNSANFSSIATDAEGVIQIFNVGAERMLGYTALDVLNRITPADFSDPIEMIARAEALSLELGTPIAPGFQALVFKASRGIEDIYELTYIRKNGSRFPAVVSVTALRNDQDTIIGYLMIGNDVTDRKQAEAEISKLNAELETRVIERTAQLEKANTELRHNRAELKSLFESLPGLYLVLSPDLKIVSVSDAYLKATLTTREDILDRNLFDVFPDNPDDPDTKAVLKMQTSIARAISTGMPDTMAISRYDVRRPDGVFEERYWSVINSPMVGANHKILYIVHRVEEVTEFVRHKQQMPERTGASQGRMDQMEAEVFQSAQKVQAANQDLEAANKELEAFSYSISHDLRAPLRAIDGYSQAVLEDFGPQLPAEGQRQLQLIRDRAQLMGQLIDDLLSFSRLSRSSLDKQTVKMDALVRVALAEMNMSWDGRQTEFKIDQLPACQGDRSLLKQVWINLLSNAIKYSRKREHALVEIGCEEQKGESVYFVRDDGSGFDMRYANKLFGVFQRLHRSEDYEGTGVGLAIAQRIIHRHGGRIWAESAVDRGATFYFTL
ncbi:MAG: ATP-binding protein [Pseudomonadota bacterium]